MAIRADDVDLDRDRDLVQRYQAGDPDAFDDLYRRYFDRLHGYCQRRVGDRHVAEELAQEAFVRALRAMPRFAGERRFYPWMTVIAQRLCIDHHRRRARVEPAAVIDLGSVEPDHDALFHAVDVDHLADALERLAPRHREVLDLRERDGLSYLEIAERLDVPVSTIEALLHRARKALRREFLAVGGHRIWGLPVLGALASRVVGLRARVGDRVPELAGLAVPAAAAAVTAAIVLNPGAGVPAEVEAGTPDSTATVAQATLDSSPSSTVVRVVRRATPAGSTTSTSGADVVVEPALDVPAVGHRTYVGSAADEAHDSDERMPVTQNIGPVEVGGDPEEAAEMVENLFTLLGVSP